jgi:hypothetical protein
MRYLYSETHIKGVNVPESLLHESYEIQPGKENIRVRIRKGDFKKIERYKIKELSLVFTCAN